MIETGNVPTEVPPHLQRGPTTISPHRLQNPIDVDLKAYRRGGGGYDERDGTENLCRDCESRTGETLEIGSPVRTRAWRGHVRNALQPPRALHFGSTLNKTTLVSKEYPIFRATATLKSVCLSWRTLTGLTIDLSSQLWLFAVIITLLRRLCMNLVWIPLPRRDLSL